MKPTFDSLAYFNLVAGIDVHDNDPDSTVSMSNNVVHGV